MKPLRNPTSHTNELHTDANSRGYGAILLHIINRSHVIEYFSKAASSAE